MTNPDGRVLILQHVPWEGPGLIAEALRRHELPVQRRMVSAAFDPPEIAELAALVVMGGPMGAADEPPAPGLAAERALIGAAVDHDVPVLGVCLGAQVLAQVLGGEVGPAARPEIGIGPVEIVADDPVLAPLGTAGDVVDVVHWHTDQATLPPGARLLARSAATANQAFRYGRWHYGLQFHLELTPMDLAQWLTEPSVDGELTAHGLDRLDFAKDADAALPGLIGPAAACFDAWVESWLHH